MAEILKSPSQLINQPLTEIQKTRIEMVDVYKEYQNDASLLPELLEKYQSYVCARAHTNDGIKK